MSNSSGRRRLAAAPRAHHLGVRAGFLLCEKASYLGAAVGRMDELTGTRAAEGRERLL